MDFLLANSIKKDIHIEFILSIILLLYKSYLIFLKMIIKSY